MTRRRGQERLRLMTALALVATTTLLTLAQESSREVGTPQTAAPLTDARTVEQLVTAGLERRADVLAARARLAAAEGRLRSAKTRPNPRLAAEYGSARFLGGEPESDFGIGVSQLFETNGKRGRRASVAQLEVLRAGAEVRALEQQLAAEVRASYARAAAAALQLDTVRDLIATGEELVRTTNARLTEGDVAPIDLSLAQIETDRLKVQRVRLQADYDTELISLRAVAGLETAEAFGIVSLSDRPPRLDLSFAELTDWALRERADLQAARLGEELGTARIRLAESARTPDVEAEVRFSQGREFLDAPELPSGALRDRDNVLTFGVQIEIPVFNRNQGAIIAAASERTEAIRQREFLEATVRRDVALAYRRYRAASETLVLYTTQIIPRASAVVRSIRAAYDSGEFSISDVLAEQRRLIEAEQGRADALRDYYTALAELERAIGTTLPASSFTSGGTSVLPDARLPTATLKHQPAAQAAQRKNN